MNESENNLMRCRSLFFCSIIVLYRILTLFVVLKLIWISFCWCCCWIFLSPFLFVSRCVCAYVSKQCFLAKLLFKWWICTKQSVPIIVHSAKFTPKMYCYACICLTVTAFFSRGLLTQFFSVHIELRRNDSGVRHSKYFFSFILLFKRYIFAVTVNRMM